MASEPFLLDFYELHAACTTIALVDVDTAGYGGAGGCETGGGAGGDGSGGEAWVAASVELRNVVEIKLQLGLQTTTVISIYSLKAYTTITNGFKEAFDRNINSLLV